jgi:hypothetical protein
MRTNSRMRGPALGLAALALVVSVPELARAQQGGLFPLAPIRRQRVPCDQEDPIYKTYKYKYFGYHPTCWRPFPEGWGCPSPEAPDRAKSFEKQKLGAREDEIPGALPGAEAPERPETTRPGLPDVPARGVDPFETQPDAGKPGNAPAAPRGRQAPVPPSGDPFQLDKPDNPPAAAPNPPRAARVRPGTAPALSNAPELSAPADDRGRISESRTSRNDANVAADGPADDGPLLALPNVNLRAVNDSAPFGIEPPPATGNNAATASSTNSPGSSPPRRGFLSGLFSNLGLNWTRR